MDFCSKFSFGCLTKKCLDNDQTKHQIQPSVDCVCCSLAYTETAVIVHQQQRQSSAIQYIMEKHKTRHSNTNHKAIRTKKNQFTKVNITKRPSLHEIHENTYDKDKLIEVSSGYAAFEMDSDNENDNVKETFYRKERNGDSMTSEDLDDRQEDDGDDDVEYEEEEEIKLPIILTPKIKRLISGLDADALRLNQLIISSGKTAYKQLSFNSHLISFEFLFFAHERWYSIDGN
jgi:hypothetical protein